MKVSPDPLEEKQLAQWQRVTEAATPGPWSPGHDDHAPEWWVVPDVPPEGSRFKILPMSKRDAEFIATARTAMPLLLMEVRRMHELADYLAHHASFVMDDYNEFRGGVLKRMACRFCGASADSLSLDNRLYHCSAKCGWVLITPPVAEEQHDD